MTSLSPGATTGLLMGLMAMALPKPQQNQSTGTAINPARSGRASTALVRQQLPGLPCPAMPRT